MDDVASAPVVAEDAVQVGDRVRVRLVDGQEVRGEVVAITPAGLTLRVAKGDAEGLVQLATGAIAWVDPAEPAGDLPDTAFGFSDPNITRYFYAPSAFSLPRGVGYVSQKELLATTAAYGLVDGVGIEAGTVLPLLFTPARAAIVGLKLGFPVSDLVHIGGGAQALALAPDGTFGVIGLGFAMVSVGVPDRHLSLGVGQTVATFSGETRAGPTLVVAAGNYRLSDTLALITENWVVVDTQGDLLPGVVRWFPAGGVRFLGRRFSADLGVVPVWIGEGEVPLIPIPWLDITWNFRTRAAG